MAYAEMIAKIQSDWESSIGATYPTMYQNEDEQDFVKPNNGVWIRLTIKPANSLTTAVGNKVEYDMPIVVIAQVFSPRFSKIANANAVVKLVHDRYAYEDLVVGDAEGTVVKFKGVSVADVGTGTSRGIYQININTSAEVSFFK